MGARGCGGIAAQQQQVSVRVWELGGVGARGCGGIAAQQQQVSVR